MNQFVHVIKQQVCYSVDFNYAPPTISICILQKLYPLPLCTGDTICMHYHVVFNYLKLGIQCQNTHTFLHALLFCLSKVCMISLKWYQMVAGCDMHCAFTP